MFALPPHGPMSESTIVTLVTPEGTVMQAPEELEIFTPEIVWPVVAVMAPELAKLLTRGPTVLSSAGAGAGAGAAGVVAAAGAGAGAGVAVTGAGAGLAAESRLATGVDPPPPPPQAANAAQ